jgi:hypothetical protein
MCVPGRRVFTNQAEADAFADEMRNEPDHRCGPESVTQEESETDPGNSGVIYPGLANIGRASLPVRARGRRRPTRRSALVAWFRSLLR